MQGGDPAPVQAQTSSLSVSKKKSLPVKILQALLPLLLVAIAFFVKSYLDTPTVQ